MKKNVGLEIGVIGCGQCGGNLANEMGRLGYNVITINTSQTDFFQLRHIPRENKLWTPADSVEGAGANPEVGREAVEKNIEQIMNLIEKTFDKSNYILMTAGLGRGTGSGMMPLLAQVLIEQGYQVGAMVTLPSDIESPKNKIIADTAFAELSALEGLGSLFVIDNAKASRLIPDLGVKAMYRVVNEVSVEVIDRLNELCVLPSEVAFDSKDYLTLLTQRGCAVATKLVLDVNDLENEIALSQALKKKLDESFFADYDFTQTKGVAFCFDIPSSAAIKLTNASLKKMQQEMGMPFETYTGIYEDNRKKKAYVYVIAVGLPFPDRSLEQLRNDLEEHMETIETQFANQQKTYSGIGSTLSSRFITGINRPTQRPKGESSTLNQILNKRKKTN